MRGTATRRYSLGRARRRRRGRARRGGGVLSKCLSLYASGGEAQRTRRTLQATVSVHAWTFARGALTAPLSSGTSRGSLGILSSFPLFSCLRLRRPSLDAPSVAAPSSSRLPRRPRPLLRSFAPLSLLFLSMFPMSSLLPFPSHCHSPSLFLGFFPPPTREASPSLASFVLFFPPFSPPISLLSLSVLFLAFPGPHVARWKSPTRLGV